MTYEIHKVGTVFGGEAFLLVNEHGTALIDSGFAFAAKGLVKNIETILGDRSLDYILLTHSHYDHVSGAQACRMRWKDAKIVSAKHAAEVFAKPSVIKKMMNLNRSAARSSHYFPLFRNNIKGLSTDIIVSDRDTVEVGDMKFRVIETPGHTWDSIAFWCEEERLLISNETPGVAVSLDEVVPACLVSFRKALESVERLKELKPKAVLLPHYDVIEGEDICTRYLEAAYRGHIKYRDMILEAYDKGMSEKELLKYSKDTLWVGPIKEGQPEDAFDLNNRYMVPTVIREFRSKQDS